MKANRAQIERAFKARGDTRFFLFYGPDESGSRALLASLAAVAGPEAERVELSGSELKSDPARLPDEAASISLFGGARYVVVESAGDETVPAIEALLEVAAAGNPVAIVAGALKPSSRLLKLALAAPDGLAFASYIPEGREADQLVLEMARGLGLIMRPDAARRIATAAGGNRAIIASELDKLALYADATPETPRQIDEDAIDAIGAAREEGDLSRLVDAAGGGRSEVLQAELARLASEGVTGIPLIRAMLRRMLLLARLRAQVDKGNSAGSVMASAGKSIFWKEKDGVGAQLSRWRSELIAKALSRLIEAELQAKAPGTVGDAAVDEELFAICRQAARLR